MCTHQDCAYLHVKHPAGTAPCPRFLQGFCPDGASCKLRHVTQAMLREERQRGARTPTAAPQALGNGGCGGAGAVRGPGMRSHPFFPSAVQVTDAYRASLFAEDASETPDDVADVDYIPM